MFQQCRKTRSFFLPHLAHVRIGVTGELARCRSLGFQIREVAEFRDYGFEPGVFHREVTELLRTSG